MGHNPATRDGKTSERKKILETRSPADIIKGIRGNLAAHLAVTPSDIAFLLMQRDSAEAAVVHLGGATAGLLKRAETAEAELILKNEAMDTLKAELKVAVAQITDLQVQVDRFREVYEQENRSHELVLSPVGTEQLQEELAGGHDPEIPEHDSLGGEA